MKFLRLIFTALGALLTLNGIFMSLVSNFNLGLILTLGAGLFFLMCGIFMPKINELTQKGVLKYIKYLVCVLIVLFASLTAFLAFYGTIDNVDYNEDAVIVLGAGIHGKTPSQPLVQRLNKAKEYYDKNPDAVIVVTGGQGFQEEITEAEAMKLYLIRRGVPEEKIIEEDKATSTYENMVFSKNILDDMLGDGYRVVVITNNFHIYRAQSIAKEAGIKDPAHFHAGIKWYNYAPCYLRECLAVLKTWVFGG